MSDRIDRFAAEIQRVIEYFRKEYDLTYGEALGVLEIAKHADKIYKLKDGKIVN